MKKILLVLAVFALASFTLINTDGEKPKAFDTSYMDPSVSPCDNFYQYAIGGWRANNPIPETESRWMAFNILNEENRQKLMKIVDKVRLNTAAATMFVCLVPADPSPRRGEGDFV